MNSHPQYPFAIARRNLSVLLVAMFALGPVVVLAQRSETPLEKEARERKEKFAERFRRPKAKDSSLTEGGSAASEYYQLAPYISMAYEASPPVRARRVGGMETRIKVQDETLQKAILVRRTAALVAVASSKKLTGSPLNEQQQAVLEAIPELSGDRHLIDNEEIDETVEAIAAFGKDTLKWSVDGDGLDGLKVATGLLKAGTAQMQREDDAEDLFLLSRKLELLCWKSIEEQIPSHDSQLDRSASVDLEINVDTSAKALTGDLVLLNGSGQDLNRATIRVKTSVSRRLEGAMGEYFVYLPQWKQGSKLILDNTLISSLLHKEIKPPIEHAFEVTVWSDEGDLRGLNYSLPAGKPKAIDKKRLVYPLVAKP